MTSKIEKNTCPKLDQYPCLMESTVTGVIVLMTSYGKGTLLYIPDTSMVSNQLGDTHPDWVMDCFIPFNGKIILSS